MQASLMKPSIAGRNGGSALAEHSVGRSAVAKAMADKSALHFISTSGLNGHLAPAVTFREFAGGKTPDDPFFSSPVVRVFLGTPQQVNA